MAKPLNYSHFVFGTGLWRACSRTSGSPSATPTSTNAPTVEEPTPTPAAEPTKVGAVLITPEPVIEPTPAATAEIAAEVAPTLEIVDWLTTEGKTTDNLTYLGNPNAAITIIDYSDFL